MPGFPADAAGWRALDKVIATRAINLRLLVAERYREVAFHAQYDGIPFAAQSYSDEAILLALDAWLLAQEIRMKYDLPNYGYVHKSDTGSRIGLLLEHSANAIQAKRNINEVDDEGLC